MISLQVAGSLFVYQREAAPKYGFLIMNRNSKENMVEVVTTELTFQKENLVDASQGGAFLLYRYQLKLELFSQIHVFVGKLSLQMAASLSLEFGFAMRWTKTYDNLVLSI